MRLLGVTHEVLCDEPGCDWQRRCRPSAVGVLVLAGRRHTTDTDGHPVSIRLTGTDGPGTRVARPG